MGKLKSSQRMFQERMDFSRWIDAGKLLEAVMVLRPNGVDVASGVCDESGVVKSKEKCDAFVFNVRTHRDE